MLSRKEFIMSFLGGAVIAVTLSLLGIFIPFDILIAMIIFSLVWFCIVLLVSLDSK